MNILGLVVVLPVVIRSYKYRLYPTKAQATTLVAWLELTRELYNAALQDRRDAWQKRQVSVTAFDQMHVLPAVREARSEFKDIPIVVLRGAIRRLDRAFQGFFRRVKADVGAVGYPRFKSRDRYTSLLIDALGDRPPVVGPQKRHVAIPLLGPVQFKKHRSLEGTPKAIRLTLEAGRWYVTFACVDVPAKLLPTTGQDVGLDVGLTTLVATSDEERIKNPRVLQTAQNAVARAQRHVSKRHRGSQRRRKAIKLLARAHRHVQNVRRQHHIDTARALVARYDTLYVEDLNIRGLARSRLAKSVHDAGWGTFLGWLACKAEEAGREILRVNPSGTSQLCSACGNEVRKGLAVRVHDCPHCGLIVDRDVNAARNILRLGRSLRRGAPVVVGRQRPEKSQVGAGSIAIPTSN